MVCCIIDARLNSGSDPIVDVPPMVGINIGGGDPQCFNRVNDLKDTLNFRPALGCQQNVTTGTHKWQRLESLTSIDGAHDVDTRKDGAVVIRCPAHEGKDRIWRERNNAPTAVKDLLLCSLSKANPVFNLLLDPGHFHVGEIVFALRTFGVLLFVLMVKMQ
jgi:hypothetical protein